MDIGTGHAYRCLTLADKLRNKGADIGFICREEKGNLNDYIVKKGYSLYRLSSGIDIAKDAELTCRILKEQTRFIDWLVIDHYEIDISYESPLRGYAEKIMVIDDLANRRHDCDILLDQNYNKNNSRYNGLLPEHCTRLLGPEYVLLRPQFREARKNLKKESGEVKRILVFMGGADPTNETGKVLEALKLLNRDDVAIDVVIGASNPFKNEIETLTKRMPNTASYFNVNNMAELMTSADLAIGASGTSTWERCCLGLPSIVMTLADNQKDIAEELGKEGVVVNLGWHENVAEKDIKEAIEHLLKEPEKRKSMCSKGKEMVDGNGARRIVYEIERVRKTKGNL